MLLLGIDVGTSSVKVSVVEGATQKALITVQYPEVETGITVLQSGWAEQDPEMWWSCVQAAIIKAHASKKYNPHDIGAIGIAYQMHGLVCVDSNNKVVRDAIIWCDGRAISIGENAYQKIGTYKCLHHLLNSPGNFTASKLAWVKEYEPEAYSRIHQILLPGDFISMRLTGTTGTTVQALSEGMFWDFATNTISQDVLAHYKFNKSIIPEVKGLFSSHGTISNTTASNLGLKSGIPVSYKAGDQPNNALALNVMRPGEAAASAGTSGVIYAVTDKLIADPLTRVNSFAHVTHTMEHPRVGVLLCINGTGIANNWAKRTLAPNTSYKEINEIADTVPPGSDGLLHLPFGNGAERMLNNKVVGSSFSNIDYNRHHPAHLFRAVQEGIACSFKFGLDILHANGMAPSVIRAGYHSMFLSDLFLEAFVNITNTPVELYSPDGSVGAALGAGIGCGYYASIDEAFINMKSLRVVDPTVKQAYDGIFDAWSEALYEKLSEKNKHFNV